MSDSARGKRGGTPSTTTPIAGPWLSPQVVKRKSVPNELPAITLVNGMLAARAPALPGGHGREPAALAGRWTPAPTKADPRLHYRDIRGVDGFHADDVITAVDVVDLAANPSGEVA